MLTLTEAAKNQIKKVTQENSSYLGIRVGVRGGGCAGLSYYVDFANEISEKDKVLEIDEVKVFIDSKSALYLNQVVLDFVSSGLTGSKFTFENPTAKKTCGCGESFLV